MELAFFEIKSVDKRNYVNIPYRLNKHDAQSPSIAEGLGEV